MSAQGRVGDKGKVELDVHGCPSCPHTALGPALIGSPTVFCNSLPALRVDDLGIHAACCNTNTWVATEGAKTVFIDGKPAHRKGDAQQHCGGKGKLIEGSPNVMVEDAYGGAAGGGAGGAAGTPGGAGAAGGQGGGAAGGGGSGPPGTSPGGGGDPYLPGEAPPLAPDTPDAPIEPDQIEVRVVTPAGEPVDGIRYELTMPDGSVRTGFADVQGVIKLTELEQRGECTLVFPAIDEELSDQP
jgi:uncharacterized Zn-binding protein involved in type VI secretion